MYYRYGEGQFHAVDIFEEIKFDLECCLATSTW